MYKVILWGMGPGYNIFVSYRGLDMVEVTAIVDKKDWEYKSVDGIPIKKPEDILKESIEYDYIIATVQRDSTLKEIIGHATKIGIDRDKIIPLHVFKIPFFDFEEYISLKESRISIISDYCYGGFLYHRFGLEFLTPTINMFSDNENYYRFISDLDRNMKLKMSEVPINDEKLGGVSCPRGKIGNTIWNFNHDVSFSDGVEKWERRVNRINWNNYLVCMLIRSDEMAYKFNELPIKNKLGFYWKDLGLDSIVPLLQWNDLQTRAENNYNFSFFVNHRAAGDRDDGSINWMNLLLHKGNHIRVK